MNTAFIISIVFYFNYSPEACKFIVENCRANVVIVEDNKQLEKIIAIKHELPNLKAVVQYLGTPHFVNPTSEEGEDLRKLVYSWREFMDLGSVSNEELDRHLKCRLKAIAVNQCCALIYTSGTTGQPKGAMMSHDNLTWTARISNEFLSANSKDIFLSYLPLSHSAAQMIDVWMPIAGKVSFFRYCVQYHHILMLLCEYLMYY